MARNAGLTALPSYALAFCSSSKFDADVSMMSTKSCRMISATFSRNSALVRNRVKLPSAARMGPVPGNGFDMSPSLASAMMKSPLAYLPERIFASFLSRRMHCDLLCFQEGGRWNGAARRASKDHGGPRDEARAVVTMKTSVMPPPLRCERRRRRTDVCRRARRQSEPFRRRSPDKCRAIER